MADFAPFMLQFFRTASRDRLANVLCAGQDSAEGFDWLPPACAALAERLCVGGGRDTAFLALPERAEGRRNARIAYVVYAHLAGWNLASLERGRVTALCGDAPPPSQLYQDLRMQLFAGAQALEIEAPPPAAGVAAADAWTAAAWLLNLGLRPAEGDARAAVRAALLAATLGAVGQPSLEAARRQVGDALSSIEFGGAAHHAWDPSLRHVVSLITDANRNEADLNRMLAECRRHGAWLDCTLQFALRAFSVAEQQGRCALYSETIGYLTAMPAGALDTSPGNIRSRGGTVLAPFLDGRPATPDDGDDLVQHYVLVRYLPNDSLQISDPQQGHISAEAKQVLAAGFGVNIGRVTVCPWTLKQSGLDCGPLVAYYAACYLLFDNPSLVLNGGRRLGSLAGRQVRAAVLNILQALCIKTQPQPAGGSRGQRTPSRPQGQQPTSRPQGQRPPIRPHEQRPLSRSPQEQRPTDGNHLSIFASLAQRGEAAWQRALADLSLSGVGDPLKLTDAVLLHPPPALRGLTAEARLKLWHAAQEVADARAQHVTFTEARAVLTLSKVRPRLEHRMLKMLAHIRDLSSGRLDALESAVFDPAAFAQLARTWGSSGDTQVPLTQPSQKDVWTAAASLGQHVWLKDKTQHQVGGGFAPSGP
jgi:hypothetical protein